MSRSNPTVSNPHPCSRWLEWDSTAGSLKYYDKQKEVNVPVSLPFTFILLDELAVIKGWHEASQSGITSNEVKDTRRDPFVVRSFKGGVLCEGLYANIRDRAGNLGGRFHSNLYMAYRDGNELKLGSLMLRGGALSSWMDFRKENRKEIMSQAVEIKTFDERVKGRVTFRVPLFSLRTITEETNEAATNLDLGLQAYLSDYLKRPVVEQNRQETSVQHPEPEPERQFHQEPEDDIPF